MNKLTKEKRNKIMMVAAATLAASALLWFLLVRPLGTNLALLNQRAVDARTQVDRGQRTIAAAPQVTSTLEEISARLKAAESVMAPGDLYAWMIQTMNQFKLAYNVDIPQISREIPCDVGMFSQYPYRAAVFVTRGTAHYHDFGKFLAGLENDFPFIRAQNLELEPISSQKPEDNERLSFKVELVALVKPLIP